MGRKVGLALLVGLLVTVAASPAAATLLLSARLNGPQEVPPTSSTARARSSFAYNGATQTFNMTLFLEGISIATIIGFHVHRAPVGVNGPIIIDFMPGGVPIGTFTDVPGGVLFTATNVAVPGADVGNFLNNGTYVNIHTPTFPGGEIRGQILPEPLGILVTGAGPGGGPHVRVFDRLFGAAAPLFEFLAFNPAFAGGVDVAPCDVTGDGFPDVVVAAGPGGGPHVTVFDGRNGQPVPGPIGSFFAFVSGFLGGVHVGCTDLDGDGRGDVIAGAGGGGGPHVRVFSGATGAQLTSDLGSFFPYNPAFAGGVSVGGN